ncbi:hypothetical protein RCH09_003796 [Actimicrobium sp. GrIS 1.19]|uniref:hypothetical protein n=1 Tax=Actimicrobium sp. GrIS 1.19 TaxID=3071708 RepID=UPI002E0614C5|nr:hypothetical protein [Actimicrobium sp. GrIS 1.19]
MPHAKPVRTRLLLTVAVAFYEVLHLGWEYLHGGVMRHHLLQRSDWPAMSNWWGLVVLPVLAWLLIGRMQARGGSQSHAFVARPIALRFLAALLYGAGFAASFAFGYEAVTSTLFFGLFVLAVTLPICSAEYLLGFVLGMTFIFGAVLPTMIACVFALLSSVLHPLARIIVRTVMRLVAKARGNTSVQTKQTN